VPAGNTCLVAKPAKTEIVSIRLRFLKRRLDHDSDLVLAEDVFVIVFSFESYDFTN
jgi:hypothetical protein